MPPNGGGPHECGVWGRLGSPDGTARRAGYGGGGGRRARARTHARKPAPPAGARAQRAQRPARPGNGAGWTRAL